MFWLDDFYTNTLEAYYLYHPSHWSISSQSMLQWWHHNLCSKSVERHFMETNVCWIELWETCKNYVHLRNIEKFNMLAVLGGNMYLNAITGLRLPVLCWLLVVVICQFKALYLFLKLSDIFIEVLYMCRSLLMFHGL
jgi:hypothetical protein